MKYIEFDSVKWRKGIDLPKSQGLVVGSKINFGKTFGYVDCDDIHLLMIIVSIKIHSTSYKKKK